MRPLGRDAKKIGRPKVEIKFMEINGKKIVLKNAKYFEGHDGPGLNADLFWGTEQIAFVVDLANGGEIEVRPINGYNNPSFIQIEKWVKEQDPIKEKSGGQEWEYAYTFENLINLLAEDLEIERAKKSVQKKMRRFLMFGTILEYRQIQWKSQTFEEIILNMPHLIREKCKDAALKGETLLNTNVPEDLREGCAVYQF